MYTDIKSRIALAQTAFKTKRKVLFNSNLGLNLMKKVLKCYVCSKAVCGAETRTLRKVDKIYLASFEIWYWRRKGGPRWHSG